METIEHKSMKFTIWDVGGLQKLRPLWRHYYLNTQGIFISLRYALINKLSSPYSKIFIRTVVSKYDEVRTRNEVSKIFCID